MCVCVCVLGAGVDGKRARGCIKSLVLGRRTNKVLPAGNPAGLGRATGNKRTEHGGWGLGCHLGPELGARPGQPSPRGHIDGHCLGTGGPRNTAQGHLFGRALVLHGQLLCSRLGTWKRGPRMNQTLCVAPKSPV